MVQTRFAPRWCLALLLPVLFGATGCMPDAGAPETAADEPIQLQTRADSVAMRLYEALGGPETWDALPYLRFNFAVGGEGEPQVVARHLWNRRTGDYRLELPGGPDSTYVVLFNVGTREGQAYLDGAPVDTARNSELLAQAYRRFINDTYWFLAPVKVFDDGVERSYVPDSSTARHDVITLTFDGVGLTPGDRYWLYVNTETGRLDRWQYLLENMPAEAAPRTFRWAGYRAFETPAGSLYVATRKENMADAGVIYTDSIAAPAEVPDALFTDPSANYE